LPPVSTATLTGKSGQANFYRSDVKINIKTTDDLSGVLNVQYNLDGAGFQKIAGDTALIKVSKEGKHAITFFSTDKAGNNEAEQTINFTIDKTAPEVSIQFDPATKDLNFSGTDGTQVFAQDKDDTIILTDQAGNTTELKLKDKDRKKSMKAEIKSLKYNGEAQDISKNLMEFSWHFDKKQNLDTLSQHVQSKRDYNVLAVFDGKNTKIAGKDFPGKISKTFSGLKLLKITTSNGDLSWSY
jgi:hypothetical protein